MLGFKALFERKDEFPEAPLAGQSLYDGFIEGVSRFPQGFFGISVFMGDAFLQLQTMRLTDFESVRLTPQQTRAMALAAERQHEKKHVRVPEMYTVIGSRTRPNDMSIAHIWSVGREAVERRVGLVTSAIYVWSRVSMRAYDYAHPTVQTKVRQTFAAYCDALRTDEGRALSADYTAALRTIVKGDKEHFKTVLDELVPRIHKVLLPKLLERFPEKQYDILALRLATLQSNNDWATV